MDEEQFGWLVERMETQAANAPRAFRIKVFLISIAAYAVLALSLLLVALALAWAVTHVRERGITRVAITVGLPALMTLPVFWVTLRTLCTRWPAPAGRAVTRKEAPV